MVPAPATSQHHKCIQQNKPWHRRAAGSDHAKSHESAEKGEKERERAGERGPPGDPPRNPGLSLLTRPLVFFHSNSTFPERRVSLDPTVLEPRLQRRHCRAHINAMEAERRPAWSRAAANYRCPLKEGSSQGCALPSPHARRAHFSPGRCHRLLVPPAGNGGTNLV